MRCKNQRIVRLKQWPSNAWSLELLHTCNKDSPDCVDLRIPGLELLHK